jgi:uncharacterized membrane protein
VITVWASAGTGSAVRNYFIPALFMVCFLEAILIPPVQAPDETEHLKRAYLLSHGLFLLDSPSGKSSGGMVDTGLALYLEKFSELHKSPDIKLSHRYIDEASAISWSGQPSYMPAPGTGFYFPLIYAPQALGLWVGETVGLTVGESCRLARFIPMLLSVVLLSAAFKQYSPSIFILSIFFLPMTLFQVSTAGLDGVSLALEVLTISCFLKLMRPSGVVTSGLVSALNISLFLLASSRVHLLPLLVLPYVVAYQSGKRSTWVMSILSSSGALLWILVAIKTTVDVRVDVGAPLSTVVGFYLGHPVAFFKVVYATLQAPDRLLLYRKSFIGILGWLDAWLTDVDYDIIGLLFLILFFCSLMIARERTQYPVTTLIVLLSFLSVGLIFFALLITWNTHPAVTIAGVQGRYFLSSALLLGYGISWGKRVTSCWIRIPEIVIFILMALCSVQAMTVALLARYWLDT